MKSFKKAFDIKEVVTNGFPYTVDSVLNQTPQEIIQFQKKTEK